MAIECLNNVLVLICVRLVSSVSSTPITIDSRYSASLINVSWGGQDFINWTFAYFISGECNDQLQSRCHLSICKWNHKRVYPKMGICGKYNIYYIYKHLYNLIYIFLIFCLLILLLKNISKLYLVTYLIIYSYI